MLKTLERENEPLFIRLPFLIVGWIVLLVIFIVIKQLLDAGSISHFPAMVILILLGSVIGVACLYKVSNNQSKYIKPFIDKEGIRKRIDSL